METNRLREDIEINFFFGVDKRNEQERKIEKWEKIKDFVFHSSKIIAFQNL